MLFCLVIPLVSIPGYYQEKCFQEGEAMGSEARLLEHFPFVDNARPSAFDGGDYALFRGNARWLMGEESRRKAESLPSR